MITAATAGRGAEMAVSKRALQATLHAIIHIADSCEYSYTLSILIDGRAQVLFCQHSFSNYFQFGNKQIIRTHFPQGKSGSDHIGLVPPRDWWQQHVTGMLHLDGFDPGRHQKKPARWAGFSACQKSTIYTKNGIAHCRGLQICSPAILCTKWHRQRR